jgi:SAM-dependent methyltransferase
MGDIVDSSAHSALYFGDTRDHWWNLDQLRLALARFGLASGGGTLEVLDVGSGVGHWGRLLARALDRPFRLVGVDREPEWVAEAFARARDQRGHWHYQIGDVNHLPFGEASFDLVTCQTVLMHLAEPRAALASWARLVRPGGYLLLAEPNNLAKHAMQLAEVALDDLDGGLRELRFIALCERGKALLGLGFNSLGEQVPELIGQVGLELVGSALCDRAGVPGRAELEEEERFHALDVFVWPRAEARRYFDAGGGLDFEHEWGFVRARQQARLEAMRAGRRMGSGGSVLYVHAARRRMD